ncbi:diguanylate cyclase [Thalassotalea sp. M1531]|uniref:diguanylate cyclase n=1 Tax=Thalassotalea algicola TaxID=2716224 RepID=A0A7Y0Q6E1_9GAMM|nr:diguanylate cyclase [Thalassotalea algicola]NMP30737.1 diguanylate cyclase [Thalassotalea algicola]
MTNVRIMYMILLIGLALVLSNVNLTYAAEQEQLKPLQLQTVHFTHNENIAQLTPEQIEALPAADWQKVNDTSTGIKVREGVNWYKLAIYNVNSAPLSNHLVLGNRFEVGEAELYVESVRYNIAPISFSLLNTNDWSGHLITAANSQVNLYLKVISDTEERLPLNIYESTTFLTKHSDKQFYFALTIGGVLFVGFVFALLFIAVHDKSLIYLAGYFVCRAAMLSVLLGSHLFYLMPDTPELRGFEFPWLVAISSIFYLFFTSRLFSLVDVLPKAEKVLKLGAVLIAAYAPLSLFLPVDLNIFISGMIMMAVMALLAVVGIKLHSQGQRLAFLFFIAMAIQLTFTIVILIGAYLEVPLLSDRESLHIASFTLNTLLIVFIIARQYFYLLQDKQHAQREALTNAMATKKANEKLLQVQADSQEDLENRVQERTLELNIALNELEELNRELEQKNTIDELTGLYNRRFYEQRILAEYRRSKRNLTSLSIVVIDIDFFKKVNDNYGHLAGDQCLSWLSQHIKQSLKRSTDVGCRYGGEEFCLILPDTEQEGAIALAEDLRKAVEAFDFIYQEQHISLTISCGIATYTQQDNIEPEHIFCAADKALYQAKRSGRNQVQYQNITQDLLIQEHSND